MLYAACHYYWEGVPPSGCNQAPMKTMRRGLGVFSKMRSMLMVAFPTFYVNGSIRIWSHTFPMLQLSATGTVRVSDDVFASADLDCLRFLYQRFAKRTRGCRMIPSGTTHGHGPRSNRTCEVSDLASSSCVITVMFVWRKTSLRSILLHERDAH